MLLLLCNRDEGVIRLVAHVSGDKRVESVKEHSEKVAYLAKNYGSACGIPNMMYLAGLTHDMGKNKKLFCDYIMADEATKKSLRGKIQHASTGAKFLYDRYHNSNTNQKILTELLSYGVASHHGLFDMVDEHQTEVFLNRVLNVEDYDEACKNSLLEYINVCDLDHVFGQAMLEFCDLNTICKKLYEDVAGVLQLNGFTSNVINKRLIQLRFYFYSGLQRLINSILVRSDWEATADFECGVDTYSKAQIDRKYAFDTVYQNFQSYMSDLSKRSALKVKNKQQADLHFARNSLRQECVAFAKNDSGIYKMTMPMGSGKTLSGLAYGLEFVKNHPETSRIIYASPHISVTSQNSDVFRSIIQNEDWLLEHHSSVSRDDDSFSSILGVDWSELFICTTLVQLSNVLFSSGNKNIRLFCMLINAVVIIDEPQDLPEYSIHMMNYMFDFLHRVLNTTVIFCTATQPTLDKTECPVVYTEPENMIQNPDQYFRTFNRTKNVFLRQRFTYDSLANHVIQNQKKYLSTLVILNTKHAVQKFVDTLNRKGIFAEYLSTNDCVEHRADVLERVLERLANHEPVVVVSTSLIEAGVDISFECVYRSLASFTSLVQSAGRDNRNFENLFGMFYIFTIEDEHTGCMTDLERKKRITHNILYSVEKNHDMDNLMTSEYMDLNWELVYENFKSEMDFCLKDQDTTVMDLYTLGYVKHNTKQKRDCILGAAYKTVGDKFLLIDNDDVGIVVIYKESPDLIAKLRSGNISMLEARRILKKLQSRYSVNVSRSKFARLSSFLEPLSDLFSDVYVLDESMYHPVYGVLDIK